METEAPAARPRTVSWTKTRPAGTVQRILISLHMEPLLNNLDGQVAAQADEIRMSIG